MELILKFYYPMNLHYSKTQLRPTTLVRIVLLPCDSAPLQTLKEASKVATGAKCTQLHYSKTNVDNTIYHMRFYYPMSLHYSKTVRRTSFSIKSFYYPMNLHYSKTSKKGIQSCYQCKCHRTITVFYHIRLLFVKKREQQSFFCFAYFRIALIVPDRLRSEENYQLKEHFLQQI